MVSTQTKVLLAVAAVGAVAVVSGGKKRKAKKKEDADESLTQTAMNKGDESPRGYMPPPELAAVWGPGPWNTNQKQTMEQYLEQGATRRQLMEVYPGLAYLHTWLKKRKIPMVLDPGYAGVRKNLQYGPPLAEISPQWETDLDSAMLKSGMGIRLALKNTTTRDRRLGAPVEDAVFQIHQEVFTGKMYAWNPFYGEFEELPISDVPKGVVRIEKKGAQVVRDALTERYPTGMAYGDADRILYAISTFDGNNRQALKVGPQHEMGRARLSASFPPFDEGVDVTAVLGKEGGAPVPGLLEDPDAWLESKKDEAINAGSDYLASKAREAAKGTVLEGIL